MTIPYLDRVREPGQTVNPLFTFLGVHVERISADGAVLHMPLRPEFTQGAGGVSGGILATLADEAMAHAVLAVLAPGETTATIEMNARFLRPPSADLVVAEATVVKRGRQIVTVEAELRDGHGKSLLRSGASFAVVAPPRP